MQPGYVAELVRRYFSAFEARDRSAVEGLLADNFTFTSPSDDDHISRSAYFEKCWQGGDNVRGYRVLNLVASGVDAFIRYECELKDGKRFRNTEYLRFEGEKIREVDVYFGRVVNPA